MSQHETSPAVFAYGHDLTALAEALSNAPRIAVDTEFVRERTYYPRLCLLQIATEDTVACIDCLADIDLAPLFERLFRPHCEWVLHSARQDLEILYNAAGTLPAQLFDTQLAAALLGAAPQIGLQDLVARKLGVALDKSLTRTDWSRRPLSEAAVTYALDDVRHLLELASTLRDELAALGRESWYAEDAARLLSTPPVSDSITIWQRLKGIGGLSLPCQAAALALVRWRETEAQRLDRPRRWVLADDALTRIARALPADRRALDAVVGLPKRLVERSGRELLAAIAASGSADGRDEVAAAAAPQPDKSELKALQERVRIRAEALGIQPEVLATRRELAAYAAGTPPAELTTGWRAEHLG